MWREWYPFPWVPVVDEEGMRFNDWFPRFTSVMAFDVTRKTLHKSLCRIKSYHCFSQRWPLNRSSSICACDASCFKIQETKEYQQPCFILVLANHHILQNFLYRMFLPVHYSHPLLPVCIFLLIPNWSMNDLEFLSFLRSFISYSAFIPKHLSTHLFKAAFNDP